MQLPLRRSARKRKSVVYTEHLEDDNVDNGHSTSSQSPSKSTLATASTSRKKARPAVVDRDANEDKAGGEKACKKRARVRGKLAMLLDMPLDILYEVNWLLWLLSYVIPHIC
jgi:hypothetical protein